MPEERGTRGILVASSGRFIGGIRRDNAVLKSVRVLFSSRPAFRFPLRFRFARLLLRARKPGPRDSSFSGAEKTRVGPDTRADPLVQRLGLRQFFAGRMHAKQHGTWATRLWCARARARMEFIRVQRVYESYRKIGKSRRESESPIRDSRRFDRFRLILRILPLSFRRLLLSFSTVYA